MEPLPLPFLLCSLLLILLHTPTSKSSTFYINCPTDANYTANSTFQSNLNLLLSSLPSAAAPSGFYNTTVGRSGADQVYGLALCRGDVSSADCDTCLTTAAQDAVAKCPHGTSNTLWYDYCMLRYSNQSFFAIADPSFWRYMWNGQNVTDPQLFDDQLGQLMKNLAMKAAYGSGRPPLFAVGEVNFTSFKNIYGLAQCTRDLSPADCYGCLTTYIGYIPQCCSTKMGGRIFGETCTIWFGSAPFYNLAASGNETAPPPPQSNGTPSPPAGSGQNRGNGSSQTGGKGSGDSEKHRWLDWGKRYKIISGIARGLLYLHEDSQLKVVHRDLKASNILLDAEMNPKISDFGLARLFEEDHSQEVTRRVVGTFGYMAPEYAMHGYFSNKSDVFSFGVIVLENITGRKNTGSFNSEQAEDLLNYIWENWTKGTITEIVDSALGNRYPRSEVLRCIQIGLLCVQENPADRPTMSNVVVMLSSNTVTLETPSKPAFCLGMSSMQLNRYSNESNYHGPVADQSSSKSIPPSPNEVSITELEPR